MYVCMYVRMYVCMSVRYAQLYLYVYVFVHLRVPLVGVVRSNGQARRPHGLRPKVTGSAGRCQQSTHPVPDVAPPRPCLRGVQNLHNIHKYSQCVTG